MLKSRSIVAKVVVILLLISVTSCYGPFNLTKKLHKWNGSLGDKIVNELVFFGMLVVPVYEATLFLDGVIFNSIEFWTGNNPIDMAEGESDTKIVHSGNNDYEITAVMNKFIVKELNSNESAEFIFEPSEQAWYLLNENGKVKLASLTREGSTDIVNLQLPDGEVLSFNPENFSNKEVIKQTIKNELLSN